MHPDLVAGAWVGFNDSRVTLRSEYWGQGGHNAVLLVGDFFKSAQKAGFADRQARFPPPPHPRVETPAPETLDPPEWNAPAIDPAEQQRQNDQIAAADPTRSPDPPDELAALHYDEFGMVIGGKAGLATSRPATDAPPRTTQALDRLLDAMGRDTHAGDRRLSVSTSGTGGMPAPRDAVPPP